ncbi:hypothetical protein M5Y49_09745 [Escherichia coli]|nr:hypothetical protein [Escherichia coli]
MYAELPAFSGQDELSGINVAIGHAHSPNSDKRQKNDVHQQTVKIIIAEHHMFEGKNNCAQQNKQQYWQAQYYPQALFIAQ